MGTHDLDSAVSFSGLERGIADGEAEASLSEEAVRSLPEFDTPRVARGLAYALGLELLAAGILMGMWEMWRLIR